MDQWNYNEGGGGGYFGANEADTPTQSAVSSTVRQQFLCPVTVRQVLEASEQGLKVGALTATMVSLCGIATNVETTSTTVKFSLSDDTGVVDCLEWLETQDDCKEETGENLIENKYYHVYGCIKFPQGRRRIMVFRIEKVKSLNEITAFMLEVLSANEYAEKAKEPKQMNSNAFEQNSIYQSNSFVHDDKDKLTPIQKTILDAISAVQNPVGWSRLESGLTKKFSEKDIQDTLDKLVCEGHIYTTIDDDHFCCT